LTQRPRSQREWSRHIVRLPDGQCGSVSTVCYRMNAVERQRDTLVHTTGRPATG